MRRTFQLLAAVLFAAGYVVFMMPGQGVCDETNHAAEYDHYYYSDGAQTYDAQHQKDEDHDHKGQGGKPKNAFNILMNYELGMHCTGFEFSYCCVLPPYNSILAQVVKTEKTGKKPRLLKGDPNVGLDFLLQRETVVRDTELDANGNFKKYVLRYWHDAQPRDAGEPGAPQSSTLISLTEGNSLLMWDTVFDTAAVDAGGALVFGDRHGASGVILGDGDFSDPEDNYANAWLNHFFVLGPNVEGDGPADPNAVFGKTTLEANKIRVGMYNSVSLAGSGLEDLMILPDNVGPTRQPVGPGVANNPFGNVLTFSTDTGTVVYTDMKLLQGLPVMLTSPRIWEALGLPLTPFEDTIQFFVNAGAIDEDTIRPYVRMHAQLHYYDPNAANGIGAAVMDGGNPVIGTGTAPIDIPNCERCHSVAGSVNSANPPGSIQYADTMAEIDFWDAYYNVDDTAGASDWYSRLKGAAISILEIHDQEHGTDFLAGWPATEFFGTCVAGNVGATCTANRNCDTSPGAGDGDCEGQTLSGDVSDIPQNTRLGGETVLCQRCHADNVIAVVKSATVGQLNVDRADPNIDPPVLGELIPPITEAIHNNHKDTVFADSLGRSGSCQGCHPAHRSDGDLNNYPITEDGLNAFAASDNRDAAGGCYVGRDVHSNPNRDADGAGTPSHLNAVGQWLKQNVAYDTGTDKGIWCTNCHSQLSQELWKAENCSDPINRNCEEPNPRDLPLQDIANTVAGGDLNLVLSWLDPKIPSLAPDGIDHTDSIWDEDPGLCEWLVNPSRPDADGLVATLEIAIPSAGMACSTPAQVGPIDCSGVGGPVFNICGNLDADGDFSVNLLDFCTTADCVAAAQATLANSAAVAVPFSAASDGRDHWLSPGEPHCADCHEAPFVEQSGSNNFFPPFNYPRKTALFRYSRGHQDITCQGCHESIHGLYPVTRPGFVPGSTKAVDQTTWDQAAGLNSDGSHGPLKCGACHEVNGSGVPDFIKKLTYKGTPIKNDFDAAVSWAHTFTEEADPTSGLCLNCHNDRTSQVDCGNDDWLEHSDKGRVSRKQMDKVETSLLGGICGSANPLTTVCVSCHSDKSAKVSCAEDDWLEHLDRGRVSESVWEDVSTQLTGGTCGY